MIDRKRVIAAYQDRDGTYIQVLDDGSHMEWSQPDQGWVRMLPPLPPEALGEVAGDNAEIKVGDTVAVPVLVRDVDRDSLRVDINGNAVWLSANTATKVPR